MAAQFPYRNGSRVREINPPHRAGTVVVIHGRGQYARVFVRLDGRGIVAFYPSALTVA